MQPEIHACRRHPAAGFSSGRPRPTATSNPGVPFTEVLPVVAHLDHRAHRSRPRLRRGRSRAYGTRPPRPSVSWKNGPARAASPAAVNALSPPTRPTVPVPDSPHHDPLQDHVDSAGLILDFPALVYNVTVASWLGHFTQAAWPHTCRGVRSPGSPVWARSPMGKWAASSWRNASVSPSRATAANLSCSTTN
jgi:hypothetical protein